MNIQVDPELLAIIRDVYTKDVAEQLGHLRPDETERLQASLKPIDEAEEKQGYSKIKTSSKTAAGFHRTECSLTVLSCGEDRIRTCGTPLKGATA